MPRKKKLVVADQRLGAKKGRPGSVATTKPIAGADGHFAASRKRHNRFISAPASNSAADDQNLCFNKDHDSRVSAAETEQIIAEIRGAHRSMMFAVKQRIKLFNALGAFIRIALGWRPDLPDKESKRIKAEAQALIKSGGGAYSEYVKLTKEAAEPFLLMEKEKTKLLESLAESLPIWAAFGEPIQGFGAKGLAMIIAQAGDLSNYPDTGKLRKRMGLAVINGRRQGSPGEGATKEDWIEHGYNKQRRSLMYACIGDPLIKCNGDGRYRSIYLNRKKYEKQRAEENGLQVVPAAKIPKNRKDEFMSEGHVHLRAQRYMEQMLLKDLWRSWRQAMPRRVSEPANENEKMGADIYGAA